MSRIRLAIASACVVCSRRWLAKQDHLACIPRLRQVIHWSQCAEGVNPFNLPHLAQFHEPLIEPVRGYLLKTSINERRILGKPLRILPTDTGQHFTKADELRRTGASTAPAGTPHVSRKPESFSWSSGAAASDSARLCGVAATATYADGAVSSGNAVAAVPSGAQAASASPAADRGRVGTDCIGNSTLTTGTVAWAAPDAEKLTSYRLHLRGVQKGGYPLKMVEMYLNVSSHLCACLAKLLPVR
jgi:hypothetical protein